MDFERDLERIALQERRLRFTDFNAGTAWTIGNALRQEAERSHAPVSINIEVAGHTLFAFAMAGTTPDNADWARRKRNVTMRYHQSSYAIGLGLKRDGTTLEAKTAAAPEHFATHGGCFPILLTGGACIGTITVSGLPQRADHSLIVTILARHLDIPEAEIALES